MHRSVAQGAADCGPRSARRPARTPGRLALPVTALALLSALVAALATGSVAVPAAEVAGALARGASGQELSATEAIVLQVRMPRVAAAAAVGGLLAVAGAAFQAVFRNPLADPYLLGAASGAGFGAALAMVYGAALPVSLRVMPAAFIGALAAVAAAVTLARRGGRLPTVSLILAGVVIGSILSAATSFVMLAEQERTAVVLRWLLGSFALADHGAATRLAAVLLVTLALAYWTRRGLDLLQVGEPSARSLGLPVEPLKWAVLILASLATAAAVATVGVIGFVGLIVPHAVRMAFGPHHGTLLPLSAAWGAAFLVAADLLARTLLAPIEVPVGVVTAMVGGPFFLLLLRRSGGDA